MKRFITFVALVALAASAVACRGGAEGSSNTTAVPGSPSIATAAIPSGVTHGQFEHDGQQRTYRLFVPEGLPPGDAPLVIGLHGGLGSGDQFAENSQFERAAQESGFIAVFPDGVGRTWNGGNCCGRSARDRIDDVGFLAALIEHIAGQLPIDRSRVFMTGHSNGGILSFRFGCERPDLVAAVASVAGSLEIPDCEPAQGVDLLSIHGDADQSHPFDGGEGPRSIAGVDFVSQARSLELWTRGMGCTAKAGPQPSGETTLITWTGCQDGAEARLLVVHGADHPWPGGVGSRPAAQERTSDTIDATAVITEFFLDR